MYPLDSDLSFDHTYLDALDLLPGWYDDWTVIVRERLRQRILHGLHALSTHLRKIEHYADAIEVAITAINADPLREPAQRVLMEAYLCESNWAEAHRAFIRYQELMGRELGISPSKELRERLFDPVHRTPNRANQLVQSPVHRLPVATAL